MAAAGRRLHATINESGVGRFEAWLLGVVEAFAAALARRRVFGDWSSQDCGAHNFHVSTKSWELQLMERIGEATQLCLEVKGADVALMDFVGVQRIFVEA